MNKKVKKLSVASLLMGSLLSAATLRGVEYANSLYFRIGEFNADWTPKTPTLETWNGCLTYFFIQGVNNGQSETDVTSVSTIQGLLNKGDTTFLDRAICSSTVKKTAFDGLPEDLAYFSADAFGRNPSTLALGNYTAFAVLFDAKDLSEITADNKTKYLVINNFTQTWEAYTLNGATKIDGVGDYKGESAVEYLRYKFNDTTAGTKAANAGNWGTFGVVPEPTSGVMLLLGVAALALKRKRG